MTYAKWTFLLIALMHLLWAAVLIFHGPIEATPKVALQWFFRSDALIALVLIIGSLTAVWSVFAYERHQMLSLALLLPQEILLLMSCNGVVRAVVTGTYPDNTVRDPLFILVDQSPILAVLLMHTVLIAQLYIFYAFQRRWTGATS